MTNWIRGLDLAYRDGRIIKTFGYMRWPDGSEHPAMRYVWWSWREMPEPTLEEPKRVVKIDQCWEPQGEYPFRPTHWAEADKPPLDLEVHTTYSVARPWLNDKGEPLSAEAEAFYREHYRRLQEDAAKPIGSPQDTIAPLTDTGGRHG